MREASVPMSPDDRETLAEHTQVRKETSSSGNNLAVLVVDSCASSRRHLARLLRECNYEVHTAQNRKAGLQYLATPEGSKIDVVLKEHDPPKSDGCRFIRSLARNKKKLPVIVVSSNDHPAEVMKCVSAGALDYLVKPLRHNELRLVWTRVWIWKRQLGLIHEDVASADKTATAGDSPDKSSVETSDTPEARSSEKEGPWNARREGSSEQNYQEAAGGAYRSKEDGSGLYTRDHFNGSGGPSGPSVGPSYEANNDDSADGGNSKLLGIRPPLAKSGSDENTSESAATQQAYHSNGGITNPLKGKPCAAPSLASPAPKTNGHAFRPYDQHAVSYKRCFSRLGVNTLKSGETPEEEGSLAPTLLASHPSTCGRSLGEGPEEMTSVHSMKWSSSPIEPPSCANKGVADIFMPPAKSPKRVFSTLQPPTKPEPTKPEPSTTAATDATAATASTGGDACPTASVQILHPGSYAATAPQDSMDSLTHRENSGGCVSVPPASHDGMQQLLAAVKMQQSMPTSRQGSSGPQAQQFNPVWLMNPSLVAGQPLQALNLAQITQLGQLNPLQAAYALQQQQQVQQQQQQQAHQQQAQQQQMLASLVQAQQQQPALAAQQLLMQNQLNDMNCCAWNMAAAAAAAAAGWQLSPGAGGITSLQTPTDASSTSSHPELAGMLPSHFMNQHGAGASQTNSASGTSKQMRAEALARWREKKKNLTYVPTVRYENRKICANTRPRVNGRFARGFLPTTSEE